MTSEALILQQPEGPPRQLVLLFHGLGADAADLSPVGARLAEAYPQALVVSVRAPHPCDFGFGFQWFSVNAIDDERRVERIAAELPAFVSTVRAWQRDSGLGAEATVLVGFSQGAMMVLEAASLADDTPLAGRVVALAGRYARLPDVPPRATTVFLVHGKVDAVVPYEHTVAAAERLVHAGGDVVADVIPFLGHEIDDEVLELVVKRLQTHVPRRHWEEALRGAPPGPGGTQ